MKVMCIKRGEWRYRSGRPVNIKTPTFGEIVTVIGESISGEYLLAEYPRIHDPLYGWVKKNFVPLSSIDESEMIREKTIINQSTE